MDADATAVSPAAVVPDPAPSEAETVPGDLAQVPPTVEEALAPASRMEGPATETQSAASSQLRGADALSAGVPTPEIVDVVPAGAGDKPIAPGREVASPSEASSAGGADVRTQQLSQLLDRMQRMQSMMGRMAQLMMPQPTLMEMQLLQAMAPPPPLGNAAGSAAGGPVVLGAEQPEAEPVPDVSAGAAPTTGKCSECAKAACTKFLLVDHRGVTVARRHRSARVLALL
jgi:hypothetical protein